MGDFSSAFGQEVKEVDGNGTASVRLFEASKLGGM